MNRTSLREPGLRGIGNEGGAGVISSAGWRGSDLSMLAIVLLFGGAFAAILLTGGRDQGSLGVFFCVAGAVVIGIRPQQVIERKWWIVSASLWLCSSLSLLPQAWWPKPAWRSEIEASLIQSGSCISIETGATLFWLAVLGLTLLVGLFVLSLRIHSRYRQQVALLAALGVAAYAALAIYSARSGWHYPFDVADTFGFFPNRNHTATLLIIGALLSIALLGLPAARLSHFPRILAGTALVICVSALLFFSISRAGVILLGVGVTLWALGCGRTLWGKFQFLALGILGVYAVILFFAIKSDVRDRLFQLLGTPQPGTAGEEIAELRWPIYEDTLSLVRDYPLTGVGLGNFTQAFAHYRVHSLAKPKVLHPESDWWQVAAEAGLPALVCAFTLMAFAVRSALHERHSSSWPLRCGLLVAAAAAALHGVVDVPAHRVPLGWWILLLGALSSQHGRGGLVPEGRALRLIFATGGAASLLLGLLLVRAEWFGGTALPPFAATQASARMAQLWSRDSGAAVEAGHQALARSPTADALYYELGRLLLNFEQTDPEVDELFRAQRLLDPTSPTVPTLQAELWQLRDSTRVPPLFAEALRRQLAIDQHTGTRETLALYRQLLRAAGSAPDLRQGLFDLIEFPLVSETPPPAREAFQLDLTLAWMLAGGAEGWQTIGPRWLAADPGLQRLSPAQRGPFLTAWATYGDPAALREAIAQHPAWEEENWLEVSDACRAVGLPMEGFGILFRRLPAPPLPRLPVLSVADATRAVAQSPDDFVSLYQLYAVYRAAEQWSDAARMLDRLDGLPGAPPYVAYLRAEAQAKLQHWPAAYDELRRYLAAIPKP